MIKIIGEPSFRLIIYGDGDMAEEIEKRPVSEGGVNGWEFTINPGSRIVDRYSLKLEDLDKLGYVKKWYAESVVSILNDGVIGGRILIKTNFDGEETNLGREEIEKNMKIDTQQKVIKSLQASNAYLNDLYMKASARQKMHIKESADMINIARTAAKKEKEEEEDGENE